MKNVAFQFEVDLNLSVVILVFFVFVFKNSSNWKKRRIFKQDIYEISFDTNAKF